MEKKSVCDLLGFFRSGVHPVNGPEGLRVALLRQSGLERNTGLLSSAAQQLDNGLWELGLIHKYTHAHNGGSGHKPNSHRDMDFASLSLIEMYYPLFHSLERPQHVHPLTSVASSYLQQLPNCVLGTSRGPWGSGMSYIGL